MSDNGEELFGVTTAEAWPWLIGIGLMLSLVFWFFFRKTDNPLVFAGAFSAFLSPLLMGLIVLLVTIADPYIQRYNDSLPPPPSMWQQTESLPDGTLCWKTTTWRGRFAMGVEIKCEGVKP